MFSKRKDDLSRTQSQPNADGGSWDRPLLISENASVTGRPSPRGHQKSREAVLEVGPPSNNDQMMVEVDHAFTKEQMLFTDTILVDRETVIQEPNAQLVRKLARILGAGKERAERGVIRENFLILSDRVASTVRAWYRRPFEQLLNAFLLFEPMSNGHQLVSMRMSKEQVERAEHLLLGLLTFVLDKAGYSPLSKHEFEVANQGRYMLDVEVMVDRTQLDNQLLPRYLARQAQNHGTNPYATHDYASECMIFRRGIGIDVSTNWFWEAKIDLLFTRLFCFIGRLFCCLKPRSPTQHDIRRYPDEGSSRPLSIERLRFENIRLGFDTLFKKNTIQEPTFERIFLLYRFASNPTSASDLGDRSIHMKQFRHVPMADMEIIMPAKKTPSLTATDWVYFSSTIFAGLFAIYGAFSLDFGATVFWGIIVAMATYCMKAYWSWTASMAAYRALLVDAMYSKQLDTGRGTLLALFDDVESQEVRGQMDSASCRLLGYSTEGSLHLLISPFLETN
eukprot:TRINITY_DN22120_c0_g1_i2.p1 TRINITY_DN22120_c0_g1~~TRINITY_DN22120_c0_g1_i2.p1  ORF type:complete len:507 (+),score=49.09 TRINITY_DN22120_c0_g1_i2:154-1674(+)